MKESNEITFPTKTFAMLFGAFNLYSVFLMVRLHIKIPKLKQLVDDLFDGERLPEITEFFIGNYLYFWSLPVVSILILVFATTKKEPSKALVALSFVSTFVVIFILQNLTYEALLAPLSQIMESF